MLQVLDKLQKEACFWLILVVLWVLFRSRKAEGACAVAQQWQQAFLLLDSMTSLTIQPTVLSYATTVTCMEQCQAASTAGRLLSDLKILMLSSLREVGKATWVSKTNRLGSITSGVRDFGRWHLSWKADFPGKCSRNLCKVAKVDNCKAAKSLLLRSRKSDA